MKNYNSYSIYKKSISYFEEYNFIITGSDIRINRRLISLPVSPYSNSYGIIKIANTNLYIIAYRNSYDYSSTFGAISLMSLNNEGTSLSLIQTLSVNRSSSGYYWGSFKGAQPNKSIIFINNSTKFFYTITGITYGIVDFNINSDAPLTLVGNWSEVEGTYKFADVLYCKYISETKFNDGNLYCFANNLASASTTIMQLMKINLSTLNNTISRKLTISPTGIAGMMYDSIDSDLLLFTTPGRPYNQTGGSVTKLFTIDDSNLTYREYYSINNYVTIAASPTLRHILMGIRSSLYSLLYLFYLDEDSKTYINSNITFSWVPSAYSATDNTYGYINNTAVSISDEFIIIPMSDGIYIYNIQGELTEVVDFNSYDPPLTINSKFI